MHWYVEVVFVRGVGHFGANYLVQGLHYCIYVTQQTLRTNEALLDTTKVAEATMVDSGPSNSFEIPEVIRRLELCVYQ